MGIEVKQNFNFKDINQSIFRSTKNKLEKDMVEIVNEITRRTRGGIDADGNQFIGYSQGYANKKARGKSGIAGKGKHKKKYSFTSANLKVDLTVTNAMLSSIKSEVRVLQSVILARIFFASAKQKEKAKAIMTGIYGKKRTSKKRKFFALSDKQVIRIRRGLERMILKITQG